MAYSRIQETPGLVVLPGPAGRREELLALPMAPRAQPGRQLEEVAR